MKKILITGANSYIGMSFENYIKTNFPNEYTVDTVDMIDSSWREKSFEGYDSVFHVAGIAHIKETKKNAHLYYEVNRDLTVAAAQKAKADGVRQFIFLSSMSVYGIDEGVITKETVPMPKSNYGKSKLEAENIISALVNTDFKVCILRPPMVYGKGCKGNFQTVVSLVKRLPVFPKVNNRRSMIYIENLCKFIEQCICQNSYGIFCPQNNEYVNTSIMAKKIAASLGKKIYLSYILGFFVNILRLFSKKTNKAFGSLIYLKSDDNKSFCAVSSQDGIEQSV